jgi:GNAT superfamily N-acetyltransferase
MQIRRATIEDMAAAAVVHRLAMRISLAFLPELRTAEEDLFHFREHLFPNNEIWVAEKDGVVVGYAARGDGWLNHLYIHPDHQGEGIGPRLLAIAMDGVDALQLWAFQQNERARRFYEKRGFVLVELTDGSGNEEKTPDARYEWKR